MTLTAPRLWSAVALLVIGVAACTSSVPTEEPPPIGSVPPGVSDAPATSPTSPSSPLPAVGRPFEATDILNAMRESRRPGGVPDSLETLEVAAAVADLVWTIDGKPWQAIAASGSCGDTTCVLELAGAGDGMAGEDVWVFEVDAISGTAEVVDADLHALPAGLAADLDRAARAEAERLDRPLDDLRLTAVRWLPPPDERTFELSYRSGDEEGSCAVEALMDLDDRSLELTPTDC